MNNAVAMYALGLDQIHKAILKGGKKRTMLVQGHMGTGKSSLLKMLGSSLTKHAMCYFDCTTKDLGDITIPSLQTMDDQGFVRFVPKPTVPRPPSLALPHHHHHSHQAPSACDALPVFACPGPFECPLSKFPCYL